MYNTTEGCEHPAVSGLSDEQLLLRLADNAGVKEKDVERTVERAGERIKNAVLIDRFADWCKEHRLQIAPTDTTSTLLYQCLHRSLVHQIMQVIRVPVPVLLAMCVRRNWSQFCTSHGVTKTWEEVSEIDVARLMLLRSKLPTS